MIIVGDRTFQMVHEHKDAWNPEAFRERYSEVLDRYDYIVGDWGYSQLRLKGFYKEGSARATRDTAIGSLQEYLQEYCNFGCAYFVIERIPNPNRLTDGESSTESVDVELELEPVDRNVRMNTGSGGRPEYRYRFDGPSKSERANEGDKGDKQERSDNRPQRSERNDRDRQSKGEHRKPYAGKGQHQNRYQDQQNHGQGSNGQGAQRQQAVADNANSTTGTNKNVTVSQQRSDDNKTRSEGGQSGGQGHRGRHRNRRRGNRRDKPQANGVSKDQSQARDPSPIG